MKRYKGNIDRRGRPLSLLGRQYGLSHPVGHTVRAERTSPVGVSNFGCGGFFGLAVIALCGDGVVLLYALLVSQCLLFSQQLGTLGVAKEGSCTAPPKTDQQWAATRLLAKPYICILLCIVYRGEVLCRVQLSETRRIVGCHSLGPSVARRLFGERCALLR